MRSQEVRLMMSLEVRGEVGSESAPIVCRDWTVLVNSLGNSVLSVHFKSAVCRRYRCRRVRSQEVPMMSQEVPSMSHLRCDRTWAPVVVVVETGPY